MVSTDMDTTTQTPDERTLLRAAGLRVTRPRVAVLTALDERPHADAATVLAAVRRELPAVSHQAVYDSLHTLTDVGLVRSIQPAGSTARYEIRRDDNHHHLVCRDCGRTVEVEGPAVERWADKVSAEHGFTDVSHTLELFGRCVDCGARS